MFDSIAGLEAPTAALPQPAPGLIARVREMVALWRARAYERTQLVGLDERMLRDIGLTKAELWQETNKAFWRP